MKWDSYLPLWDPAVPQLPLPESILPHASVVCTITRKYWESSQLSSRGPIPATSERAGNVVFPPRLTVAACLRRPCFWMGPSVVHLFLFLFPTRGQLKEISVLLMKQTRTAIHSDDFLVLYHKYITQQSPWHWPPGCLDLAQTSTISKHFVPHIKQTKAETHHLTGF